MANGQLDRLGLPPAKEWTPRRNTMGGEQQEGGGGVGDFLVPSLDRAQKKSSPQWR